MTYEEVMKTHKVYGAVCADASYVNACAELDIDPPNVWNVQNTGLYSKEVHEALDTLTPETIRGLDYEFADNWGDAGAYVAHVEAGDFDLAVALVIDENEDGQPTHKLAFCMTDELSFHADLEADVKAGKLRSFCRFAAMDEATGAEAVVVWLPDGTQAIADGTRFAESDWEDCGRLEVHAPTDDDLDEMALAQAE